jgi:hypothetical protein
MEEPRIASQIGGMVGDHSRSETLQGKDRQRRERLARVGREVDDVAPGTTGEGH